MKDDLKSSKQFSAEIANFGLKYLEKIVPEIWKPIISIL